MMQSLFAALFLAVAAALPAAAAEPTLHEVYQAAESGHLKQAEAMMDQVLREHPNSAKAHFVDAELLAKEGRVDMAKAELATAERLSPGLAFTKTESVQELKARLAPTVAATAAAVPAARAAASDSAWVYWLVGLLVLAAFAFFVRSLMRPRVVSPAYGYAGAGSYGQAPGGQTFGANPVAGPMPGTGGGLGSGMLGGLATGVAVGAGVVAGEALMHRVLDGGHAAGAAPLPSSFDAPSSFANDDMGGSDFGVSDAGSWDDGGGSGGGDWN